MISLDIGYRPPYHWQGLLAFLRRRAILGVESVDARGYRRTVQVMDGNELFTGWIAVTQSQRADALCISTAPSLLLIQPKIVGRVKHLLDIACDPQDVQKTLGDIARAKPGLRVPGAIDGFELAVRAILGQQVSVVAARTLAGRLVNTFGESIDTPFSDLTAIFPSAEIIAALSVADIAKLGIVSGRARSIFALAQAVNAGELSLWPGVDVEATIVQLKELPGIGEWTAQYIAMRALAWPDAFPASDLAVMKALGTKNPKHALAAGEKWRPWRAYAVMHLWAALEP